jgi:hypothetical protein
MVEKCATQMPAGLRRTVPPLSIVGLSGVFLTFWFGFEEPNVWLAVLSVAMLLTAPLAAILHLTFTRTLSAADRRIWWNDFTGADMWSALSEYLSSTDLSATAQRRAADAAARRL